MVDVVVGGTEDPFWEPPMFDPGPWLANRRSVMDTNECRWLEVLADFDRDEGYAIDGQLNAAAWLMWATGMARSTAYEKLRMASELSRRPVVKEAFAQGEISYSAARAICSLDKPDPQTDVVLVNLAKVGSVVDVEAAVRYYQLLASQDLPPFQPEKREVSSRKGHHGLGAFRAVLTNDEVVFIEAAIKAFMAAAADPTSVIGPFDDPPPSPTAGTPDESARADSDPRPPHPTCPTTSAIAADRAPVVADPLGESARADSDPSEADEFDVYSDVNDWRTIYGSNRADALMEMVSVAMANLGAGHVAGADRYMVHVVTDTAGLRGEETGIAELADGSPLPLGTVARMACDASFVAHLLDNGSEPLKLGRRVRDWSPAQRRAVRVRDRGRCRFPGCLRHLTDIHHIKEWAEGGSTDVSNAASLCGRHHTLVHQGFRAEGDGNGELVFHRPNGTVLGVSRASRRPATLRRSVVGA